MTYITVFRDLTQCDECRRFDDEYCLFYSEDLGNVFLQNVCTKLSHYAFQNALDHDTNPRHQENLKSRNLIYSLSVPLHMRNSRNLNFKESITL
jgi:predicted alpha/beta-fold hydrolase